MNARCAMAGGCSNDALAMVRIYGVGDRALCQVHIATLTRMGMDHRVLETSPAPEWRARLTAKEMTGSLA
jgi:hypothetical protein